MIYVTGDTHAELDIGKLNTKRFPQQKEMSKDDYVIICGDFGLVWDGSSSEQYWQKWLQKKNFTTLWIDGNHENFDYLSTYPVTQRFGGNVQEISPGVFHLCRGQIFTIDGKRIFCMGGAKSIDVAFREDHVSWWKEEIPSRQEMENAIEVLDRNNWTVDYVLTHCAPRFAQAMLCPWYENDPIVSFLERVRTDLNFKQWYFGHYHVDRVINDKFIALYNNVVPLE